jgi:hypothetical protein
MSCAALNGRPLWVKIDRSIKSYHRPDSAAPHKADERNIIDTARSLRLELMIVALILLEIIFTGYQIFFHIK